MNALVGDFDAADLFLLNRCHAGVGISIHCLVNCGTRRVRFFVSENYGLLRLSSRNHRLLEQFDLGSLDFDSFIGCRSQNDLIVVIVLGILTFL